MLQSATAAGQADSATAISHTAVALDSIAPSTSLGLSEVTVFDFGTCTPQSRQRPVIVETPVNIVYAILPYAVMMMTPANLEDFAIGFSLSEGIIQSRQDIRGITVAPAEDGIRLIVDLVPERLHGLLARRRAMAGRTGCGVCGIEDLAAIPRAKRQQGGTEPLRLRAIQRALAALRAHQPLNRGTGAVHAAVWANAAGDILCAREDVGRHNALDKLLGALLGAGIGPQGGFVLLTSRCSFEMVEKAAAFGVRAIVAVSAPTMLGIARAREHGITLIGIARHDSVTAFTGADRVTCDADALA